MAAGLFASLTHAADVVGQITHLSGLLTVKHAEGGGKIMAVKSNVLAGDLLTTEKDAYARIKFSDSSEVVIRPQSQFKVEAYAYSPERPKESIAIFNMIKGGFRAVTGLIGKANTELVNFKTPTATIGIRGTHFGALFCQGDCAGIPTVSGQPPANGLHVDVADGAILVRNPAGQQVVNTGQFGYVASPTTPPVVVPPQQGIQVTMPTSISQNSGTGKGIGKGNDAECVAQ